MSTVVTKSKADKELEEVMWFLFKLLIFGVVCFFSGLGWLSYKMEERLPLEYSAWSKHTGNPGNLTFEEWKHLPRETRKR